MAMDQCQVNPREWGGVEEVGWQLQVAQGMAQCRRGMRNREPLVGMVLYRRGGKSVKGNTKVVEKRRERGEGSTCVEWEREMRVILGPPPPLGTGDQRYFS